MLYNPNWQKKIESLDSLIAWLEKQNPTKTYHYSNPHAGLLQQYFQAMGLTTVTVGVRVYYWDGSKKRLPRHFNKIAVAGRPTFGSALSRAYSVRFRTTFFRKILNAITGRESTSPESSACPW